MNAAVIYYSLEGNTADTAEKIAKKLDADLIRIQAVRDFPTTGASKYLVGGKAVIAKETPELKPMKFVPSRYDTIILGTPVWASSFAPPVRTFIRQYPKIFKEKRTAFFLCEAGRGEKKCFARLREFTGVTKPIAEMVLLEPLKREKEGDAEKIAEFCARIQR